MGDEAWLCHNYPRDKARSEHWLSRDGHELVKAKADQSREKMMIVAFWNANAFSCGYSGKSKNNNFCL